jgi:hypothetical protein
MISDQVMSSSFPFLARVVGLSLICAHAGAQTNPTVVEPLSLGQSTLSQSTIINTRLAPGVHHLRIQRGTVDKAETWKLMSEVLTTPADVAQAKKCFEDLGVATSSTTFQIDEGLQRYEVLSGGQYATRAAAQAVEARAQGMRCTLFARHSSDDETNEYGPWLIDVVTLEPGSTASLSVLLGKQGPNLRTRTTEQAKAANALAAVNGGFFLMRDRDGGFAGQPSGISIVDGRLNSGPAAARPAVLIRRGSVPAVSIVRNMGLSAYMLWQDGSRTSVDGVNRKPGIVRNCGQSVQDKPIHDYTCSYADDVVYFPPDSKFASANLGASTTRFAIDKAGSLRRLLPASHAGQGEAVLAMTNTSPRLAEVERQVLARQTATFRAEGEAIEATAYGASLVNGGPTLLMDGKEVHDEVAEGWGIKATDSPKHDLLIHDWVNRRNPRTALGIKDDGTVMLVAVDGHRHDVSVGLTLNELRRLMKGLGARDAINLDGGGSTAMVVGGRLINKPSDPNGERAVGDVLAILPKGAGK